jgi:hypothetical protein
MAKKLKLKSRLFKNKFALPLVVLLFAGVGVYALINSHAATQDTYGTAWFQFRTTTNLVINGGSIWIYDTPQSSTTCKSGSSIVQVGGPGGMQTIYDNSGNFTRTCLVSTIGNSSNQYKISQLVLPSGYQYANYPGSYNLGSTFNICANQVNCSPSPGPMAIVVEPIPASTGGGGGGGTSAPHGYVYIGATCSNGTHATGGGYLKCAYNTPVTVDWNGAYISSCKLFGNNKLLSQWSWGTTSGSYKTGNLTSSINFYMSCQDTYGTVNSTTQPVIIGSAPPPTSTAKITSFTAKSPVSYGTATKISWSSVYTYTCSLYQGSKQISSGSGRTITTGKLYGNTGFTLKCYNI